VNAGKEIKSEDEWVPQDEFPEEQTEQDETEG